MTALNQVSAAGCADPKDWLHLGVRALSTDLRARLKLAAMSVLNIGGAIPYLSVAEARLTWGRLAITIAQ